MTISDQLEVDLARILFSMPPHEMMINLEKVLGKIISKEIKTDDERVESAKEIVTTLAIMVGIYDETRLNYLIHALTHQSACNQLNRDRKI